MIQSAKVPIEKDIYQVITPIVKKVEINGQTEVERYVEIAIHDERLSNIITKCSQKEIYHSQNHSLRINTMKM